MSRSADARRGMRSHRYTPEVAITAITGPAQEGAEPNGDVLLPQLWFYKFSIGTLYPGHNYRRDSNDSSCAQTGNTGALSDGRVCLLARSLRHVVRLCGNSISC